MPIARIALDELETVGSYFAIQRRRWTLKRCAASIKDGSQQTLIATYTKVRRADEAVVCLKVNNVDSAMA